METKPTSSSLRTNSKERNIGAISKSNAILFMHMYGCDGIFDALCLFDRTSISITMIPIGRSMPKNHMQQIVFTIRVYLPNSRIVDHDIIYAIAIDNYTIFLM